MLPSGCWQFLNECSPLPLSKLPRHVEGSARAVRSSRPVGCSGGWREHREPVEWGRAAQMRQPRGKSELNCKGKVSRVPVASPALSCPGLGSSFASVSSSFLTLASYVISLRRFPHVSSEGNNNSSNRQQHLIQQIVTRHLWYKSPGDVMESEQPRSAGSWDS